MVTLFFSHSPLSFEHLFHVPSQTLRLDWYNKPLSVPVEFFLACDEARLWFGAAVPQAPRAQPHTCGDFFEGLWHEDVVELFLTEDGSQRYQEFNLSPYGAWWSSIFSAPRQRSSTPVAADIECMGDVTEQSWVAAMAIPVTTLGILWRPVRGARLNICAIQGRPQQFASSSPLGAGEPDFHQPRKFTTFELEECPTT